jgi:hypothetical protein
MDFRRPRCKVETLSSSGVLRVTITPQLNIFIALEAAAIIAIALIGWKDLPAFYHQQPVFCILFGLGLLGGFWYQITGSEEIEFNQDRLTIRKNRPMRTKTWEHPLHHCMRLEIREPGEGESDRLSCNIRGDTVTFGADLSFEQATDILVELQRVLPDAAHQLLARTDDPFGKHFTTLNLG